MTGTGIIHSNNLQICPGGFQSGRVTGTNTLSINNYLSPPPPPPRTSHLMFWFPITPRQVDVFQRNLWGCVGRGPGRAGQRGVCSPTGPRGLGVLGAQTALLGRVRRAEPPRHVSGRLRGRSPGSRENAEGSPLSPGAGAVASLRLCPLLCARSSASSPCQLTDLRALVPTGGTILGSVCPRCGGEEGRSAAWQGFVLPRREQGNQTETFEGS